MREPGEPWGLEFAEAVFDGVRVCRNDCVFCFMSQLPAEHAPRTLSARRRLPSVVSPGQLHHAHESRRATMCSESSSSVSHRSTSRFTRSIPLCGTDSSAPAGTTLPSHASTACSMPVSSCTSQIVLVPGVNDREILDGDTHVARAPCRRRVCRHRAGRLHTITSTRSQTHSSDLDTASAFHRQVQRWQ